MITPDHPAAIAQLGQVETGGKDPDDNIAGKSPARTPSRVRRQPSPNHGPRNPPQTPVEMSQGKAVVSGDSSYIACLQDNHGTRPDWGSRSLGCLGEARSMSKSLNYIKVDLRFEKTAGKEAMSMTAVCDSQCMVAPSQPKGSRSVLESGA